ncbi:SAVED domain-containing protein [Sneathiella glossodoripedis]|uniref:SAVED domain-containing protein n=1 Tax=Sneathiella glossodoripedis TaxID=418853 RepID=UPI00131EF7E1|nr:SAVED domain-containing protein [Sneathiella glossodoripedis]
MVKILKLLIEWYFRRPPVGRYLVNIGLAILTLVLNFDIGHVFSVVIEDIPISYQWARGPDLPTVLNYVLITLGLAFLILGLIFILLDWIDERKTTLKQRIIAIELKGLRDMDGPSLVSSIPAKFKGQREDMKIDLRQNIHDGYISDPTAALEKLRAAPTDLKRRLSSFNQSDVRVFFGGLAPVPMTFYLGSAIDDEVPVCCMDWDRHIKKWRELDEEDDDARFEVIGLDEFGVGSVEVVLTVSVSMKVDLVSASKITKGTPIVQLELKEVSFNCHWSEMKQRELGKQFLDVIGHLSNLGVKTIHLFLAGQSSIVFRFGALLDRRNIPNVRVYQYQRDSEIKYPWSVLIPSGGRKLPEIIATKVYER